MDALTTLFNHNLWANQQLFERCAELSDEQLSTTIPGAFGTIRDTLEHIATAELAYLSRISTGQRYQHPDDAKPMTIGELAESVQKTGKGLVDWAQKVQADEKVLIDWNGAPREVPKTIILAQVINHATEHRAQIFVIMTQLGIQPPNLDSWTYFDEADK
jgi:uncharacterized damage-inducible protein DinB